MYRVSWTTIGAHYSRLFESFDDAVDFAKAFVLCSTTKTLCITYERS
jgi:hypothetical protein